MGARRRERRDGAYEVGCEMLQAKWPVSKLINSSRADGNDTSLTQLDKATQMQ